MLLLASETLSFGVVERFGVRSPFTASTVVLLVVRSSRFSGLRGRASSRDCISLDLAVHHGYLALILDDHRVDLPAVRHVESLHSGHAYHLHDSEDHQYDGVSTNIREQH